MSFALTTPQMRARTKTVTRRNGWCHLKPGERLIAIEKGQGLKKGERQVVIGEIEVVSVRREPLTAITPDDVKREGFPDRTVKDFVLGYMGANRGTYIHSDVTRIEFRHVEAT